MCILFDPEDPRAVAEFTLIAASAGAAGFAVEDCSDADWPTVLGLPGRYDAVIVGSEVGPSGDPDVYATDGPRNYSGYSNPQVDELLAGLATERDADARSRVRAQIDALLWEDFYGVPLYQYPAVTAFDQDTVRGITPVAFAPGVFWNVWDWTPADATG